MRRAVGVGASLVALAWAGSASAQDVPPGNSPTATKAPIESLGFDVVSVGPPHTYGLYLRAHY